MRRSKDHWLYDSDSYFQPYTIFTPEEIANAGFVNVEFPCLVHDFDNPNQPIMKFHDTGFDVTKKQLVVKTNMLKIAGIRGLNHYKDNQDKFKPEIINQMKRLELHYVYSVMLSESPVIPSIDEYWLPVFVRGCRLPKKRVDKYPESEYNGFTI